MVKLCHDLNAEWHPTETWRPVHYIRGFHDMLVIAEALERAGKKVGYENLTGDAMKDAMETIKDFEPMDYGIGFTWTPTDHQGIHGIRWSKWLAGGSTEPVGGWDVFDPLPDEQRTLSWWTTQ